MKKKIKNFFAKDESYYEPSKVDEPPKNKKDKEAMKEEKKAREYAFDKFKSRRSIRKFSDEKVNWKCIYDIIDAALYAPCAGNVQNYHVIVIEDKTKIEEIARIESQQYWIASAPVVLAVVREERRLIELYPDHGEKYAIQNSAAMIQNILMLAHFHGFGACWVESCDSSVIGDLLDVPHHEFVDAIIPIGYQNEVSQDCDKIPITERIYFEKYGQRKK